MDIASMLEVEVQEVADSKENVTPLLKPQQTFPCQTFSKEENDFYKLTYGSDIAAIRFLKLHCTGCDEHIGSAPSEAHNMHEHPVLRTLLCAKCREFYGDGTFEQGDDATDMFCRWCANGGNLYCCSYCSNTFCSKCIKRNFDPPTIKRIEAEDSWKCFVCDPKDLYPLRSIARALITHIETVTRILERDRRTKANDVEEMMHLDESKCCSRKRKRRRRRTTSLSDDEEEDTSYVPEMERPDSPPPPPVKRRKQRSRETVRNVYNNGYGYHDYCSNNKRPTKNESDPESTDIMIPCEQTMIEGDAELIDHSVEESIPTSTALTTNNHSTPQTNESQTSTPALIPIQPRPPHLQPKTMSNNSMINPVPLANLLKVALSSVIQKTGPSSSISFVKPTTHFLVPKNINMTTVPAAAVRKSVIRQPSQQPSVIDLDSDDEPVILESNNATNNNKTTVEEIDVTDENVLPEQTQNRDNAVQATPPSVVLRQQRFLLQAPVGMKKTTETTVSLAVPVMNVVNDHSGMIPLKLQQRDQRFKKMLQLQSHEIDTTLNELKSKVMKLLQSSTGKPQHGEDLLNSAAVCTKRFHRALRKTLVELAHINDRVVRDYVHWKKKTDKAVAGLSMENSAAEIVKEKLNNTDSINKEAKSNIELSVEMICERDSESEGEDDEDNDEHTLDAITVPSEFAHILDHLSLFKRKVTSAKAVGDSSVLTEDKACQAYDVPWRDYEKCIGYSLLTRSEFDPETQKELLRPVVMPDENFGKYQEQFLYYLQHIEDMGIATDEMKGLPDPNHIPLKDLIDGTSPFITDMLERLSPVTLSNGCSPTAIITTVATETASPTPMDTSTPPEEKQNSEQQQTISDEQQDSEARSTDDNGAATSKAVEELVKMVTKLSEDLRTEQSTEKTENKEINMDKETLTAVNSIIDVNNEEPMRVDGSAGICDPNIDECTILD